MDEIHYNSHDFQQSIFNNLRAFQKESPFCLKLTDPCIMYQLTSLPLSGHGQGQFFYTYMKKQILDIIVAYHKRVRHRSVAKQGMRSMINPS
jgi:hypothetical protein